MEMFDILIVVMYAYVKLNKEYTLNMCNFMYFNYISMNLEETLLLEEHKTTSEVAGTRIENSSIVRPRE